MEKIESILKSKEIDYSQEKLSDFWLANNQTPASASGHLASAILSGFLQSKAAVAEVVCIATAELLYPELVKWCIAMADKGARIYLLTASRPADAAQLAGSCLLRFDLPLRGSMVLVNPQNDPQGLFLDCNLSSAALSERKHQAVEMDTDQTREAYSFFAHHFWSSAKQEIVDRLAKATNCKPAGFSVPQPIDKVEACRAWFKKGLVHAAAVPSAQWKLESLRDATLVTDFQVQHAAQVGALNRLHVNAQQAGLHCICTEDEGLLFAQDELQSADIHYALNLNPAQHRYYVGCLTHLADSAEYAFVHEDLRQRLVGRKVRVLGEVQDRSIADRNIADLQVAADSFLSLAELSKLQPSFADDGVTCKLTYRWKISPYFLPKSAAEDSLYQKWKSKQSEFLKQIGEAKKTIDQASERSKGIASGLMRFLKQVVLGKSQQWQELAAELDKFSAIELHTKSAAERWKIVERFNAIQKELATAVVELDQKVEEAKEQEAWESKRNELADEISKLEEQLSTAVLEIQKKEESFRAEESAFQARFAEWLKSKGVSEAELPKLRNQWEQASSKKNRDKNPQEAEYAKNALQELEKLDPSILTRRHASDMKSLEQNKQQAESRLQKKKADLEKMGSEFKPSRNSNGTSLIDSLQGRGGSSASQNVRTFPDDFPEDLPKVGALFASGNKRYLAITDWGDEEMGRKEADRLKATLCATPEN